MIFIPVLFCSMLSLLYLSCIVQTDREPQGFTFDPIVRGDTIGPWDDITVIFTEPLHDSARLHFNIKPYFTSYSLILNDTRDTARLHCSEPLNGASRYVIRLESSVLSAHGNRLTPSGDSILIHTWPAEQEPNDSRFMSDTIVNVRFGTLTTVQDTDWYCVVDSSAVAFYLVSTGSQNSFITFRDSDATIVTRPYNQNDTMFLKDGMQLPLNIAVHSYSRSAGGYYKAGIILRKPVKY